MTLLVTPGQLASRAELYNQLAAMLRAGIGLVDALQMLARTPPAGSFRPYLLRLCEDLGQGYTFAEAMLRLGKWLPEFDIALLKAGEESGRVDAVCRLLSQYYQERARIARQVIADLLYPLFVLHAAVLLFPFPTFFQTGNLFAYLAATLGVLVPIYLVVFLLVFACQGQHGEWWRSKVEMVTHFIPVLGAARRQLALARLTAALEALLAAGVSIIEAWELAAVSSGSPALKRRVLSWRQRLFGGETPGEALSTSPEFPDMFTSLYRTAELSGQIDQTLKRLHEYYQYESSRRLALVSQWVPRFVYLAIMIGVGMKIIGFYSNYFDTINQLQMGF